MPTPVSQESTIRQGQPLLWAPVTAVLGAVLTGFVLLCDVFLDRILDQPDSVVRRPEFLVWVGAHLVQGILAGVLGPFFWARFRAIRPRHAAEWIPLFASGAAIVVLLFGPLILAWLFAHPVDLVALPGYQVKMAVLLGLVFLAVILPGIWCLWRIAVPTADNDSEPLVAATRLLHEQHDMQELLHLLGLILVVGTLEIGAVRQLVLNRAGGAPEDFPAVLLVAYGVYNSLLLGIIYAPAFFTHRQKAFELRQLMLGLADDTTTLEALSRQERVARALGIETSFWQSLQAGLSVAAPLAVSLLSMFMR